MRTTPTGTTATPNLWTVPGIAQTASAGLVYFMGVAGSDSCTSCPKGYYQPTPGGHMCLPCPAGSKAVNPASVACTACEAGTYSSAVGHPSVCTNCPVNTFAKNNGSTTCL